MSSHPSPLSLTPQTRPRVAVQPCGALLVLDADCTSVLQASANLADVTGTAPEAALRQGPGRVLGRSLAQHLRRQLRGSDQLPGALSAQRRLGKAVFRFQIEAQRSGERVLVDIEDVRALGKRRLLADLNGCLRRLAAIHQVDELLDALAEAVQALTGHDRVLVCAFDAQGHGAVVAERTTARLGSVLGMRFPARDLPVWLRERHARQALRSVPDIEAEPVALIPPRPPQGEPTCLLPSRLRAISPLQRRQLRELGVASFLSLAIHGDAGLWGLVICQGASPHPLAPEVRDAAQSLVQLATQRLFLLKARAEARYRQRVQDSRTLLSGERDGLRSPAELLTRHGDAWLALFRAQGVALVAQGVQVGHGTLPAPDQLARLVARLAEGHRHVGPWYSHALARESLAAGLDLGSACGLLAVPLGRAMPAGGWLLLFRPEQHASHSLAGVPGSDRPAVEPLGLPLLRRRHRAWEAAVRGGCQEWERIERLAALDLAEDLSVMESAATIRDLNDELNREREELSRANRRLEALAHHDPLTGVWNRYRVEQAMEQEIAVAARYGRPLALLMFDVDHFKQINDTHGHALGDRVLATLAREVQATLRASDCLGRWGGEEFLVLATSTDLAAGLGLAERLRQRVEAIDIPELPEGITVSIGVAAWRPEDGIKRLVQRADQAMYRAKRGGRNRVVGE